jgi:hypothetical protein
VASRLNRRQCCRGVTHRTSGRSAVPAPGATASAFSIRVKNSAATSDDEPDERAFDRLILDDLARGLTGPASRTLLRWLAARGVATPAGLLAGFAQGRFLGLLERYGPVIGELLAHAARMRNPTTQLYRTGEDH